MTDVTVVVGAQFGSEGKGAIAAHLTREWDEATCTIRVAGPNAGHTVWDNGREWKLRAVPVAAVTGTGQLHIAAGSEVDPSVLHDEIWALDEAGYAVSERLTIHPSATVLLPGHQSREAEAGLIDRVGSTGKGIGAARSDRIMRRAATFATFAEHTGNVRGWNWRQFISEPGPFDLRGLDEVLVEGTQGYGLGLHTEFYPQTTSSDCRAVDFLAMAGISPWDKPVDELKVMLVARVYPIRVAGNSGPLKNETTWDNLGLPEERTTVTNKVRRVGEWDQGLVLEAIAANGGGNWSPNVELALTMLDQLHPEMRDQTELLPASLHFVQNMESTLQTHISLVGTGPETVVRL